MSTLRTLFHLMRADFLERVRGYGFLTLLLFTVFLEYLFIPDINDIQIAGLNLGGYRAIYNSAWIGSMTALLMGEFFLLFSFYLLKGSIERDRLTGVGQILAATPITKTRYMLGKWLSNITVAAAMIFAIVAASILLQLIRAEDPHINLWALASPFLIVLFPALTIIAAVAVLFDSLPAFRGGVGNVLFFVVYLLLFLPFDPQGNAIIYPSIYRACAAVFTGCNPSRQIDAGMPPLAGYPAFHYEGVDWTVDIVLGRFSLIFIGLALTLLAAWLFHRFDPARSEKKFRRTSLPEPGYTPAADSATNTIASTRGRTHLTILTNAALSKPSLNVLQRFTAELRLSLKGMPWIWFLFALGLFVGLIFVPLEIAHLYLLPLAFVLPLTVWSNLGVREVRFCTDQIVFSAPRPLTVQLPVQWLLGVFLAFILTVPLVIRLVWAGGWSAVAGLLVGVLFVPSLGMALGCWSNNSRLFEGGYLFIWYLASVHGVPIFDFMGRLQPAREQGIPLLYAGLSILLLVVTLFARKRQIRK